MHKRNLTFRPREERGFVLILVLVLLALVTILVVASSIMARIERRASWNTARVEQARQNALFALSVAVGQLQRAAGPDQRVTARADILSSATSIAQPYWTGVWKTYDTTTGGFQYLDGETGGIAGSAMGTGTTGYNIRQWSTISGSNSSITGTNALPTCPNMVWLVSGGTNNATVNPSTTSTPTWMSNSVVLAKNLNAASGTPGATGTTSVSVPLVPIMGTTVGSATNASGTSGKYGYWVSDEGVKARVNLADPTYGVVAQTSGSNFVQNQLHFLTPQANPVQNGLLGSANTTDLRNTSVAPASDLNKVTTLQSMSFVGSGATPSASALTGMSGTGAAFFSSDATTYSRGVLADVSNGGLKKDLSQIFEDTSQFAAFVNSFTNTTSPMLRLWQPVQPVWDTGDATAWSIIAPCFDQGNVMTPTSFGTRWQSLLNYYSMYKNTVMTSAEGSGSAPWSNINAYSMGITGTSAPKIDERVFNYGSYANGALSSGTSQQVGEYYLPHVLGFEVNLLMQSVPGAVSASGTAYSLIIYAMPQVILYNPYNVILTASNSYPYTLSLSSNIFAGGAVFGGNQGGHTWSIGVVGSDAQSIETNKPIGWSGSTALTSSTTNGVVTTSTNYVAGQITFVTGTSNFQFQPGEIKVVGLQATQAVKCPPGNLVVFDGATTNGLTDGYIGGTPPGNAQYQYVYADTSTNGAVWSGTCANPGSDNIQITIPPTNYQGYTSNNGSYNLSTVPSFWPIPWVKNSNQSLGRFFNASPSLSSTTVTIGPLNGGMSSNTIPNQGIAVPFMQFYLRVKGMQQPASTLSAGAPIFSSCDGALNPMPLYFDDTIQDIQIGFNQNSNSTSEMQGATTAPYDSYWGTQDAGSSANDPSFLILHDLPRQPMISLGQFMHMAMRNSMFNGGSNDRGSVDTNSCLYPVGGSLADPFFALKLTNNDSSNPASGVAPLSTSGSVTYFDDNFLMNQALFDTYYFSSVPPPSNDMDPAYKTVMGSALFTGTTAFTATNLQNGTVVLPNTRMHVYRKNNITPTIAASFIPGNGSSLTSFPSYEMNSASLLMDGAFNVNSTSVQAWASLLSSLSGNQVSYLIPSSSGGSPSWSSSPLAPGTTVGTLQNPIFRILSPVLSGNGSSSTSEINSGGQSGGTASLWAGVNALSNAQVQALATSIVNQVKLRGPFLSMADFLNRRLDPPYFNNGSTGPTTGFGLKGALQAAIDNTFTLTGTHLNNDSLTQYGTTISGITNIQGSRGVPPATGTNVTTVSGSSGNFTVLQAEMQNTAEGVPGWLMQQDLVQCFSPVMTVRSDTFVVRCYGEADNQATGATEGRAWGEAVVQRVPDYVDQTDPVLSTTGTSAYGTGLGDATPPYDRVTPVLTTTGTASSATPVAIVDSVNQMFGRRFKVISFRWLNETDL